MHLTAPLPTLFRRDLRNRRRERAARPTPAPVSPAVDRAKRSSCPEDTALYSCHCGYAFWAEVSTSVGCPHCGTGQAW
jgi:hypothetical protein